MTPFTVLEAIAAPLPVSNVDTDMLVPARFLKTVSRTGLAGALFHTQRMLPDGTENPDFILNRPLWRDAQILLALDNFGCGSSREHAPWALLDFGIKCIIAPSFADIFHTNCFKNGILPIKTPIETVQLLLRETADPQSARLIVDLFAQRVTRANGESFQFSIDPTKRERLLKGQDDIGISLTHEDAIARYEARPPACLPAVSSIATEIGLERDSLAERIW